MTLAMRDEFHPELRAAARWLPRGVVRAWLIPLLQRLPAPSRPLPAGVTVTERALPGRGGASVRVIGEPSDGVARPAVLWIHGGGYVMGRAKTDDAHCARLAKRLRATVLSVDYRLAPGHPFPTPLDDCLAAYELLHREAASLGIDPARVVIGGLSAGGGLAAALVLRAHDLGLPAPALQLLVYPMLDDRTALRDVDDRLHRLWDPASNRVGWSAYLGRAPGGDGVPDHAAPARRRDLAGLPPAWIGVGTADLFHDEDVTYAARLRDAGVPVTLDVVEGAFHAFDVVAPNTAVSRRFFDAQVAAIEGAWRPARA
jgi:acetyl esterase/lipase